VARTIDQALKTIATFATPEDAHNLRAFLEGSGIAAFVRDENMGASYSNAIGGIKVDVEDEDFERSAALYASVSTGASGDAGPVA
jgi:hypothetical protein